MHVHLTEKIYDTINQMYFKVHDAVQIYDIETKMSATKQRGQFITKYSNVLYDFWQEMDYYQCIQIECSKDIALLKRFIKKDQIYNFLFGLNVEFDVVRVHILRKEDLPSLNEVIVVIRTEE